MEPFIAQIILFAGNFAPRGWAFCNGQLLAISQNSALFSIVGTTYGGDGVTTFALPDLRSRVPLHAGHGSGLSNYTLGQKTGVETVTLTSGQIPSHTHDLVAAGDPPATSIPIGNSLAAGNIYVDDAPKGAMHTGSVGNTGGSQSHDNIQPVLALNYIIALVGTFPSRN